MKPAFEDADENDFFLFNYLEGNLSEAEKRELEEELLTDVALQTELSYWRESFIQPEPYDVTSLESKLLMAGKTPVRTTGSLQAIIAALLASLLSLVPVPLSVKSTEEWHSYTVFTLPQTKNKQLIPAEVNEDSNKNQPFVKEVSSGKMPVYKAPQVMVIEPLSGLAVTLLPESKPDGLASLQEKEIKVQWKKKPAMRMLSRKERRQIARMKERALQRRIQNEFLKGRVPYVVPLNTSNF
jgi:hypothetical protein